SSYYAIGSQQDVFLSFRNSKSFNLGSIFSDRDFISLEPGVEVVGGTLHYLEEYQVRRKRQNPLPIPVFPGRDEYTTETRDASSFDILSYNVSTLLGYNRRNYLIETGYQLSVLGKSIAEGKQKPQSFFSLGIYYQF
ncbi:MAG: hypothetical protein ACYCZO_08505, partial [Daejeonella sp.]